MLYRHPLISGIEAQDCDFLLKENIVPPQGMTKNEVEGRLKKVRNFIVSNTGEDSLHIVSRQPTPFKALDALDYTFDPRGKTAKYSLIGQLNSIVYDPDAESALDFNT